MRSFAIFCLSPLVGGQCSGAESDMQKQDSKLCLKLICSVEFPGEIDGEPLPKICVTEWIKSLERVA